MKNGKGTALVSVGRRARLDQATAKGKFPTKEGDRVAATSGPSTLRRYVSAVRSNIGDKIAVANKFKRSTNDAAEGIKSTRTKYRGE